MSRRIECRSEGCANEVLFKTVDGAFDDRRGSGGRSPLSDPTGRGSPSGPHHRHSSSIQVSPYCKLHTCIHFHGDERCVYQKPPHDTVCAIHARCPVPNCTQARAQFLEPNFDPLSNAVPRYARFDVCSDHKCALQRCPSRRASSRTTFCQAHACQADGCANLRQEQRSCCEEHQCKTRGCRTTVEGEFPYCALHIKCQATGCGQARHLSTKTKEYLAFCTNHVTCPVRQCAALKMDRSSFCDEHTCRGRDCPKATNIQPYCEDHRCAESTCRNGRSWAADPKYAGTFCALHTCRYEGCRDYVDSLAMFCSAHGCSTPRCHDRAIAEQLCEHHFREHYIAQGKHQARSARPRNNPFKPPKPHKNAAPDQHTNRGDTASESSDNELELEGVRPRGTPANLAHRPSPRQQPQPPPPSYTEPGPKVEFFGSPRTRSVGSNGGGGGGGGGGRSDVFLQMPQAEGAEGEGGVAAGRRRPHVEDADEDSEGWGGDN